MTQRKHSYSQNVPSTSFYPLHSPPHPNDLDDVPSALNGFRKGSMSGGATNGSSRSGTPLSIQTSFLGTPGGGNPSSSTFGGTPNASSASVSSLFSSNYSVATTTQLLPPTPGGLSSTPQITGLNTLSLKTSSTSTSIYQTCVTMRSRLLSIDGFAPYLSYIPTSEQPSGLSAVDHIWSCLRLGSSLVFVLNRVGETGIWGESWTELREEEKILWDWENGEGGINWGFEPQNTRHCKKSIFAFLKTLQSLKSGGKWNEELWNVSDLLKDDTNLLVKCLQTLNVLLDLLGVQAEDTSGMMSPIGSIGGGGSFASLGGTMNSQMGGPSAASTPPSAFHHAAFMHGIHTLPGAITPSGAAMLGSSPAMASGGPAGYFDAGMGQAANTVKELLETERKYVQELEYLQTHATSLVQLSIISADTAHHIFSTLSALLDFQRRFQISLETEADRGPGPLWREGRWGAIFAKHEAEFDVYEPFCANYLEALDLVEREKEALQSACDRPDMSSSLTPQSELPAFLIKPIQRLTKYPLFLEQLLKATSSQDYPYYADLEEGREAILRVTDRVNEASRAKENAALVVDLIARVEDWKGHDPKEFGSLVLHDTMFASKGGTDREYLVYLFQHMLLCCREVTDSKSKKMSKSNSMLKKPSTPAIGSKKNEPKTPLTVKGRIYINNLIAVDQIKRKDGGHGLQCFWRSPNPSEPQESLVLHMKNEDQLKKWSNTCKKLMDEEVMRSYQRNNAKKSSLQGLNRNQSSASFRSENTSPHTQYYGSSSMSNGRQTPQFRTEFDDDDALTATGDDEGLQMHGRRGSAASAGSQGRRGPSISSHPDSISSRSRANTSESISDWRLQQAREPMPAVPQGYNRTSSSASAQSEASSTATFTSFPRQAPRSQVSNGNLRQHAAQQPQQPLPPHPGYSNTQPPLALGQRYANGSLSRIGSQQIIPTHGNTVPPTYRNRSASSPNVYQVPLKGDAPPVPPSSTSMAHSFSNSSSTSEPLPNRIQYQHHENSSKSSLSTSHGTNQSSHNGIKRSSQLSNATTVSDESHSPTTPFGSSPENTSQPTIHRGSQPVSRQGSVDSTSKDTIHSVAPTNGFAPMPPGRMSRIRIHFDDALLVVQVQPNAPIAVVQQTVMAKVTKGRPDLAEKVLVMKYFDPEDPKFLIVLRTEEDWDNCILDHEDRPQIELSALLV